MLQVDQQIAHITGQLLQSQRRAALACCRFSNTEQRGLEEASAGAGL